LRTAACFVFSNFPELRRIATECLVPKENIVNPQFSATIGAALGHFIDKTQSLEDCREDWKGTKDWCLGGAVVLGKASAKGRTKWGVEGKAN
jgi:hypothetical protein